MRAIHLVSAGIVTAGMLVCGWTAAAPTTPAKPAPPKPTILPATKAAAVPAKPAATSPAKPAPPRPVINLTATTTEPRRAQVRLASFIYAIQAGDYKKASTYLSRRVSAAAKQQLVAGPWLRKTRRNDFTVLLYMKEIELRTITFKPTQARIRLLPRTFTKTRGQAFGIWDIPMVLENNRWMLNIHPDRVVSQK